MASNNTSASLRAATVSRALAKAGVARARLSKAGLPQYSGFVARDSGLVDQVTVRWATLSFGAVRERKQGLGKCETALKAAGYKVQRDGDRLTVSRPKVRYTLMDAVSGEEFGDFESLDEADRFLVHGGISGVEWAESDDGESRRGCHKGEKAYIVRRKTVRTER